MRRFYRFTWKADLTDLEQVSNFETGDFNTDIFASCTRFDGVLPDDIKLWITPGRPTDILANGLGWPIIGERLVEIMKSYSDADLQIVSVPLFNALTKEPILRYKVINILRWVEAIDLEQSVTSHMTILGEKVLNVIEPVFRTALIPSHVHIFRPKESPLDMVISEELARAISAESVGVALIPTKSVP